MKKHFLFIYLLLVGLLAGACSSEIDSPYLTVSEIELLVPLGDASIDLGDKNIRNISFAWEETFIVETYNLMFSISPDLSNPQILSAKRDPWLVSTLKMDEIAGLLGVVVGKTGKIYWTVQSGKSSQPSVSETRSIDVTRMPLPPAELIVPQNDAKVEIDYKALDTEVEFKWETLEDVSSYNLLISTNSDLSDPIVNATIEGDSKKLSYSELQKCVENEDLKMKRFKGNTLYWNVKGGDKFIADRPRTFKLYGAKVFTDVRGEESITYEVALIPYTDNTEGVWMKENLRTKKMKDGTDLVYEGAESDASQYIPVDEILVGQSKAHISQEFQFIAGMYYRLGKIGNNSPVINWPELIVPEGWVVPEVDDFKKLGAAALKVSPNMEVIRNAGIYPDGRLDTTVGILNMEMMNLWGMNMGPSGINRSNTTPSYYLPEFTALASQHMTYVIGSTLSQVCTVTHLGAGIRTIGGIIPNAPFVVRLIYVGDDN